MKKVCGRCKQSLSIDSFYRDSKSKTGYHSHGKVCSNDHFRVWRQSSKRREYEKTYGTEWRKTDHFKEWRRGYEKQKRLADPGFRMIQALRTRQKQVISGKQSTTKGLGCNSSFLKSYIESLWTEGMTWDNYGYGKGKWVIDHKIPLVLLSSHPEITAELIHYTNLQPLWFEDNATKGASIF